MVRCRPAFPSVQFSGHTNSVIRILRYIIHLDGTVIFHGVRYGSARTAPAFHVRVHVGEVDILRQPCRHTGDGLNTGHRPAHLHKRTAYVDGMKRTAYVAFAQFGLVHKQNINAEQAQSSRVQGECTINVLTRKHSIRLYTQAAQKSSDLVHSQQ